MNKELIEELKVQDFNVVAETHASCTFEQGGIVAPCKHCANTLTSRAELWYPVSS